MLSVANDSKILGGVSGSELHARARPLGSVTDLRADYFQVIVVFANAANPDPVALLVDDYGVVTNDNRPVRARDLLWLLALKLDLAQIVSEGWFEARGSGGDHPIVDLDLARWELHSALDHGVRGDYLSDVLVHLKGVVGLKGWAHTPVPVRWHEDRYTITSRADVVVRTIEASLPEHTWEIDYDRAIVELAPFLDIRVGFKVPKRIPKIGSKERSKRVNLGDKVATSLCVVWRSDADADAVKRTRELVSVVIAKGFGNAMTPEPTSLASQSIVKKPAVDKKPSKAKSKKAAPKTKSLGSSKRSVKKPTSKGRAATGSRKRTKGKR